MVFQFRPKFVQLLKSPFAKVSSSPKCFFTINANGQYIKRSLPIGGYDFIYIVVCRALLPIQLLILRSTSALSSLLKIKYCGSTNLPKSILLMLGLNPLNSSD